MDILRNSRTSILFTLIIVLTAMLLPCGSSGVQAAAPRTLSWSVVNTPWNGSNGMLIGSRGINDLALGSDGRTFYMVDTANQGFYKSTDAGRTWPTNLATSLTAAGAILPVWNVAVAPDDVNFVVAVSDGTGAPITGGPTIVYYSVDGGANWSNWTAGLGLGGSEYIRDIDISMDYGGKRDIGLVTSDGAGHGRWLVRFSTGFGGWIDQTIPPGSVPPWAGLADYYTIKFSPTYNLDSSVALVYATLLDGAAGTGTFYNVAHRDTNNNITDSYVFPAYGIEVAGQTMAGTGHSPAIAQLLNASLQLPADFSGQSPALRRAFISLDSSLHWPTPIANDNSGIYRIDDTVQYVLKDTTSNGDEAVHSIAYSGSYSSGSLLAGGTRAIAATAMAYVWQCNNAQFGGDPGWTVSDELKSPTGGGGTGFASVLLAWSGGTLYCGTSSEKSTVGGTGWLAGRWPGSKLTTVLSDESAFQYSTDGGTTWNQVGIINTILSRLSDAVAVENAEDSKDPGGGTLYLASLNTGSVTPNIDSVWRSTSNPLGQLWERIFTLPSGDVSTMLRLPPPDTGVSGVVVLADLDMENIAYSSDYGYTWKNIVSGINVKDIALLDENTMFVLDDYTVNKLTRPCGNTVTGTYAGGGTISGTASGNRLTGNWSDPGGGGSFTFTLNGGGSSFSGIYTDPAPGTWNGNLVQKGGCPWSGTWSTDKGDMTLAQSGSTTWSTVKRLNTDLTAAGHTICCAPRGSSSKQLVFVGSEGNEDTSVAWADFSAFLPEFTTLEELPMQGNVHVVADDRYGEYKNIYAGINDSAADSDGTVYRWTMEGGSIADTLKASTDWDPLEPIDRGFYGLCMLNDVLYGAWITDIVAPTNSTGADRTLEARVRVPPPPPWDQLVYGLPQPDDPNKVKFTREPSSLHISSNSYNTLWAIDNRIYNFTIREGCLWQFVDSVARLGPWPTAPALGSFTGADPVTGRAQQIDFKWRPLSDIFGYDVLIAKDADFTLMLSQNLHMTPIDPQTGAWVVTPADQEDPSCWMAPGILEEGRSYYWKVRASRSISGIPIHSPWSPTMFFSVRPGFKVTSANMGPTLLAPKDGACSNCRPPISFSWSPIKAATEYEIVLATDAELKNVLVKAITTTTGFEYRDKLELMKPYFWQVRATSPVISDPSPVGTFSLAENIKAPQKRPPAVGKAAGAPAASDFVIWIIIVIVSVLFLLITIFVIVSRRRDE